jgi:type I restriction-modification system DNA methylase subunit
MINPLYSDIDKFTKCDIFTPDKISKLMASKLNTSQINPTLLEPSVGNGKLLNFIDLNNYSEIDVYELKEEYLKGLVENKNVIGMQNLQINNKDFLKVNSDKQYDHIIMNPPYIKIQDLSPEYRDYIRLSFHDLNSGMIDIYYAFILKCLGMLKDGGTMVTITPNSYLYNKSAYNLRKYIFDNKYVKEIIDFKDKKVFKGVSVYCCITVFTKTDKKSLLYNSKEIPYENINKNYSIFNFEITQENKTLKDVCTIKNGIATLRDKIYIHNEKLYDEPCWVNVTNGPTMKFAIYPYKDGKIIDEEMFSKNNQKTYAYLKGKFDELAKRDKGNKKYPSWYAYGRSQSIKYSKNTCLYIPCFLDAKTIETSIYTHSNILHQSCLCIEPKNPSDIDKIKKSIINNKKFINDNSSKRSGGWITLSSRILYQIPFDESE